MKGQLLAAEEARFTVAYTAIGLAPDGGSTFLLPRLIGPKRAYEFMVTNEALSAEEAKALLRQALLVPENNLKLGTEMYKLIRTEDRGDDLVFEIPDEFGEPPDFE